MFKKFRAAIVLCVLFLLVMVPVSVFAGTDSSGGITLNFPDNMTTCEPTFHFMTDGVDPSWQVKWDIFQSVSGNLVKIASGSTTGNMDVTLVPSSLAAGDSQVYAIFVAVIDGDKLLTKLSGQWRVDCDKEPPGGGEGCTPGFWKNHPDVWPIPLNTDFDTTFGTNAFDPDITMFDAVNLRGGQLNGLSRHAAAAYLNAVSPVVSFDLSPDEVIAAYQAAIDDDGDINGTKNMFEALNEQGCPY